MTRGLPPLSRLMTRRTNSTGTLLAAACLAIRELRLPLTSRLAVRWLCAEAADAEASTNKIVARQELRIMSAPGFGEVRFFTGNSGDFVTQPRYLGCGPSRIDSSCCENR